MQLIGKILQKIYFGYFFTFFILSMLGLFPFMLFGSLFGRIKGGNIVYRLCTLWADICFPIGFIRTRRIFETPHDKKRPFIFVTNHISYLDAALAVKVIRQPLRILAKEEMTRIPVFGFIYGKAVVTVKRDDIKDRIRSLAIIKSLVKKNISVLFFPEGTFNMSGDPLKEFYSGAFRVAIESQTPIKPVLFLDDFDRMPRAGFTSITPGKCRAVYLEEIPVNGLTIADVSALKQKTFEIMSKKLREYKVSWINKEDEKISLQ
jgi:1-acyl-sn-glycerol-3-phosphate acyltransferase